MTPLLRASILYSECVGEKTAALEQLYASYCSESLDSDVLEAQIRQYESSIQSAFTTYHLLSRDPDSSLSLQNNVLSTIHEMQSQLHQLRDKLRRLYQFHAASARTFESIASLEAALMTGLNQVQQSFTSYNSATGFVAPKDMNWVVTVEGEWVKRSVERLYHDVVKKVESGQYLTEDDISAIYSYAQLYPDELISQRLLEVVKKFVDKTTDIYDENSTKLDVAATIAEQLGLGIQRVGGLITILEGIRGPATTNAQGISTSFVLVKPNGVGQAWVQEGSKIASFAKGTGYGLMGLGFSLGMYDDIANKDKNWGQAFVHNGLSTGLSWGSGVGTTALITGLVVSNPVGWTAVGVAGASVAVSAFVSWGFEAAYNNNFLGLRVGLDAVGDWLDDAGKSIGAAISKGVEDAKSWTKDFIDDVGKAFLGSLNALNPFD